MRRGCDVILSIAAANGRRKKEAWGASTMSSFIFLHLQRCGRHPSSFGKVNGAVVLLFFESITMAGKLEWRHL